MNLTNFVFTNWYTQRKDKSTQYPLHNEMFTKRHPHLQLHYDSVLVLMDGNIIPFPFSISPSQNFASSVSPGPSPPSIEYQAILPSTCNSPCHFEYLKNHGDREIYLIRHVIFLMKYHTCIMVVYFSWRNVGIGPVVDFSSASWGAIQ